MGSAGAARRESGADSCWCSCWWGGSPSCGQAWWSRRLVAATMTVANLLMPVAGLIKARYRGAKADIDSPFFKLHYRTTATLFFICCPLVTANDLIGSTISCFGPEGVPGGLLNTYCWIMSTFRLGFLMFSGGCDNCPPSGWSFTFFHLAFVIVFFLQNDQESTKYRKIMCGRLRHSSLNDPKLLQKLTLFPAFRDQAVLTLDLDRRLARRLCTPTISGCPSSSSSRASCSTSPTTCGRHSSTRRLTRSPPG